MPPTIAACMIVRNEAQLIGQCLASVAPVCDEIIVVDTGSTDDTVNIARAAGARVIDYRWDDSYGRARNVSLRAARTDWVLVIDGDECISRRDVARLRELVTASEPIAYRFPVRNYTRDFNVTWNWRPNDGTYRKEERFSACPGWTHTQALRLFRRLPLVCYSEARGSAHVTPAGSLAKTGRPIVDSDGVVIHHFESLKRGGSSFIRQKQELRLQAELLRARRPPYERDAFLNAAKTLFSLERDSEAVKLLARAIQRYPRYADAHRLWGVVEFEQGNLVSARRRFRAAILADPQSADAWAMLGVTCVESGQRVQARRALMRALQIQPGHLLARNSLGVLYEDLGRIGEARREYRAALELHPGFLPARTNLARLLKSH